MNDTIRNVPVWAQDAVWYQIFPERFHNGDPNNDPKLQDIDAGRVDGWRIMPWTADWYALADWEKNNSGKFYQTVFKRRYGGDLQGIINKLDYLQDLGITAIYLNPVFRSPSLHKYDGSCFHHIEETFGPDPAGDRKLIAAANETEDPKTWVWTAADKLFLKLVKEVHKRKMKIIIDGVFNHSGRLFFAFQDILKNKQKSRYVDWYTIEAWNPKLPDGFEYKGWFGHKSLPEFKRDGLNVNPGYKKYVFDITKRWQAPNGNVANGIDGWRLDVAFCLPHGFWKEWRQVVKNINPRAYLTAEVVEIAPEFLWGDEFDALMNYPFAYTVSEFFIDRKNRISAAEFNIRLKDLREKYPKPITYVMQNLMSSHDTARLATLIVNPDQKCRDFGGHFMRSKVDANPDYRIDRGDTGHRQIHKLIATFQMTYVGSPMIYYGDEAGMSGANDPDCRKPMLWPEFTYDDEAAHPLPGHSRPREPNIFDRELFNHYRKLIRIRNRYAALRRGSFETIVTDDDLFGFKRVYRDRVIMVIINNSPAERSLTLAVGTARRRSQWLDVLSGRKYKSTVRGELDLTIAGIQAVLLKEIK